MVNHKDFSFNHLKHIFNLINEQGLKTKLFRDFNGNVEEKSIYLRHDVDQSIEKAREIAKLEAECGLKSTFFLRLTSIYYNVFHPEVMYIIKEIEELGHDIGLHFDERVYHSIFSEDFESVIDKEVSVLNIITSKPIKAISYHRPRARVLSNAIKLEKYVSAYQKELFIDIDYLSDSNQFWHNGCLCGLFGKDSEINKVQVLLHPIWWGKKNKPTDDHLNELIISKVLDIERDMFNTLKVFNPSIYNKIKGK